MRDVEKKYRDQQQNQNDNTTGKVGDTIIDKKPLDNKESRKDESDYVDFEEVDE